MFEHDDQPSATADAILRGFAPACLREPYLRVSGARGWPERQVGWAFGFAELTARYLIALLAPEGQASVSLDPVLAPTRPVSSGVLVELADGLARAVLAQPAAVAAPIARCLRDGGPTPALMALKALVTARNDLVHGETGPTTVGFRAQHWFDTEGRDHLRTLVRGLEAIRHRPIHALDDYDPARPSLRLLRFVGAEPEVLRLRGLPAGLRPREPVLIAPDGRWVPLSPLVALEAHEGLVPRLVIAAPKCQVELLDPYGERALAPTDRWLLDWRAPTGLKPPPPPSAVPDPRLAEAVGQPAEDRPDLGPTLTVQSLLARGSSASVWLVADRDGRPMAAKVLHPQLRRSARHRARLLREVSLLTRLSHPGVVRTLGLLEDVPAAPVLLMDYAAGADLSRAFSTQRARPSEAVAVVGAVLDALAHLHAAGVVHRDVKPA
ncbi:MAG: protein kinase, partial [Myxococcales bacterium]|nr:protein kinase [Myxococcales bacterium]